MTATGKPTTFNVSLSPAFGRCIREKAESGLYASASEAQRAAESAVVTLVR